MRSNIYQRLHDVLTGSERGADFAAVSDAERAAILGTLRDTLPDFHGPKRGNFHDCYATDLGGDGPVRARVCRAVLLEFTKVNWVLTTRRHWLSTAIAAACAALVPSRSTAAQADARDEEAAIRAARASQNRAIAAHDLDAIATTWSMDYVGLSSTNLRVVGRNAKREDFARQFAARPNLVWVRTPASVIVNTAWAHAGENGQWTGEWTVQGETTRVAGVYFAKWRKEDGVWRILGETFVQTSCSGSRYCDGPPGR